MAGTEKNICPECDGKKVLSGTCTCDMEWRGTQQGEDWDDCQCTQETECPVCNGTGFVD